MPRTHFSFTKEAIVDFCTAVGKGEVTWNEIEDMHGMSHGSMSYHRHKYGLQGPVGKRAAGTVKRRQAPRPVRLAGDIVELASVCVDQTIKRVIDMNGDLVLVTEEGWGIKIRAAAMKVSTVKREELREWIDSTLKQFEAIKGSVEAARALTDHVVVMPGEQQPAVTTGQGATDEKPKVS